MHSVALYSHLFTSKGCAWSVVFVVVVGKRRFAKKLAAQSEFFRPYACSQFVSKFCFLLVEMKPWRTNSGRSICRQTKKKTIKKKTVTTWAGLRSIRHPCIRAYRTRRKKPSRTRHGKSCRAAREGSSGRKA